LIDENDCITIDLGNDDGCIDYEKQFDNRYKLLKKAYDNSYCIYDDKIESFKQDNNWVSDYALFMALKYQNGQLPWYKWDKDIVSRGKCTVEKLQADLKYEINFWIFLQYLFFNQYFKLKEYANNNGICIIGDMPIYAAEDSADVWAGSEIFMLDENKKPLLISGVPPDAFSNDGQLWGNPVYDWVYLKGTSYKWWIDRIGWSFKLYDALRIDHFRGFDKFWAVPYGSENAISGQWLPAYGKELFQEVKANLGDLDIIAEDLGIITDSVTELRKNAGLPGMKVFQFAFDGNPCNPYLPMLYEENCVAYTGTHDNDTLKGWYDSLTDEVKKYVLDILNISDDKNINYDIIKALYESKSSLCVIPLQDFLSIGSEGRINTPSTSGNNWTWRLKKDLLTNELAERIKILAVKSKRTP